MADCQESKGTTEKAPWEDRWLRMYRKCGNISVACQAADVTRGHVYRWRRLRPEFAAAWDEAREDAYDSLEEIAWQRAKRSSDTLLIFLMKANRPEKYREQFTILLKRFQDMTDEQVNEYLAQRLIEAPAGGADSPGDAAVELGLHEFED